MTMPETNTDEKVVLLVELAGGDVVAVPFSSRDRADWWEERMPFEILGRPRVVSARSLAVGVAMRAQRERQEHTDTP